nr:MAG TPA: hypothetical protein [Caudoviricetes sp.]
MLFGFNPFIYKAFGAFPFFTTFVPPILLFIIVERSPVSQSQLVCS